MERPQTPTNQSSQDTTPRVIDIIISFSSLYQDPNFKHKIIHWDHFSKTPYDEDSESDTKPDITQPKTPASPSLTEIAQEFAKAVSANQAPASTSATDLAKDVAQIVTTECSKVFSSMSHQPQPQASIPGTPQVGSTGTYLFCTTNLPPDVLARYKDRIEKKPVIKSDLQPYSSGNLHYLHGTGQIILLDGSVFPIIPINEKVFRLSFPTLPDLTAASIRQWYIQATDYCHQHGVYMHGYWCFRDAANNLQGFSVGNDSTDDLPSPLQFLVARSDTLLYHVLKTSLPDPETHPSIKDALSGKNGQHGHQVLKTLLEDIPPQLCPYAIHPCE